MTTYDDMPSEPALDDDLDELLEAVGELHRGQARIAYRLAVGYGHRLMHVRGVGWHVWDGGRWAEDERGAARRAVLAVLREALAESLDDTELRKDVRRCESATAVAGVLELAAALRPFARTVHDLDADPYLINTPAGTLDLHTLELREHDPADLITKCTAGRYVPGISGGAWRAHLELVLPDAAVRGFLQCLVGVALLGKVREHVLPIMTGVGSNGKSTTYGALLNALGDYAGTGEPELFLAREGAHPTGEFDLRGRRLVVVSETDEGRKLAEATMKRLTGGDPIKARRMRQDFVEFEPSHTALLVTNHLPKVRGDDPAIWRRVRVIPFDVVIGRGEMDLAIDQRLQLDADGIVTWAVEGYAAYVEAGGLAEPAAVLAATDAYRVSSDALGRFVEECCLVGPHWHATTSQLFSRWTRWCADDGTDVGSLKTFAQALDRRGYPGRPTRTGIVRQGIGLLAEDEAGTA